MMKSAGAACFKAFGFSIAVSLFVLTNTPQAEAALSIGATTGNYQSTTGGGSLVTSACPGEGIITGIDGQETNYEVSGTYRSTLTKLTAHCGTLAADGLSVASIVANSLGPFGSSTGTALTSSVCSTTGGTRAIVGARLYKTSTNQYAGGVKLLCGTLPLGSNQTYSTTIGTVSTNYEDIACSSGSVVTGLYLNTGGIVDSFGITCARITNIPQTMYLSALSTSSKTYPYTQALSLSTTNESGSGAITYSIKSGGTASSCSLSSSSSTTTISASSSGTCLVQATIAADANFATDTSGTRTFTFNKATQAITLSSLGTSTKSYPYSQALSATTTGSSGTGAITYAITGGTATSCALSTTANTATISATTIGTCLVAATIATDTNYEADTSASATFTFTKATRTLTLSSLGTSSKTYPFSQALSATTSVSGGTGAITLAIVSGGGATSCGLSNSSSTATISASSSGTCLVSATIAEDANFEADTSANLTFTFNKASQTLTLNSLGTSSKSYPYSQALSASTSGSSGTGSITYSIISGGSASSCALSNSSSTATITASTSGTCYVAATIATDTNYLSDVSGNLTFTFNRISQSSLSVTSLSGNYGSSLTLTSSGGSSGGSVTYSYAAGTTTCTLTGSSLTANAPGTCLITATKGEDVIYASISSAQATITFEYGPTNSTVTIAAGTLYYRQEKSITAVASVAGKITFKANNRIIPGCRNLTVSVANSLTRVCTYRPFSRGFVTISVSLAPSDSSYLSTTSVSEKFFVYNRTGNR